MSKIPMQPWFPDAHISRTATLSLEAQGAYRLLMDYMWIHGGYLKDNDKEIAKTLRTSTTTWRRLKVELLGYLTFCEGLITQERLQRDYIIVCEKSQKNAENGRKGGKKTAENLKLAQATAAASQIMLQQNVMEAALSNKQAVY